MKTQVGSGPHSSVFEALCTENGQNVCIKKINLISFPFNTRSLQATLTQWSKFVHPNVLEYYGSFIDGEFVWIIEEYMDAGSLYDIIHRNYPNGCKNEKFIAAVAKNILTGLSYYHYNNRNHTNVKVSNVLLNHKGELKLSDFNISTSIVQTGKIRSSLISMNEDIIYLAPEILNNSTYSAKSDIWAFGLIMAYLANGQHPYANMKVMEAVAKIISDEPPTIDDSFSLEFRDFVRCCLTKEPTERSSADELLHHKFLEHVENSQLTSVLHFAHPIDNHDDQSEIKERHGRFLITRKPSMEFQDYLNPIEEQMTHEIASLQIEIERLESEYKQLLMRFEDTWQQLQTLKSP